MPYLKKLCFLLVIFMSFFASCEQETDVNCPPNNRRGAICNDGTRSNATSSGACSSHGGVDTWLCR